MVQGITTYSSKDLVNWKLEATDEPSNTFGWFGRLGVAYAATSKKYVLPKTLKVDDFALVGG